MTSQMTTWKTTRLGLLYRTLTLKGWVVVLAGMILVGEVIERAIPHMG